MLTLNLPIRTELFSGSTTDYPNAMLVRPVSRETVRFKLKNRCTTLYIKSQNIYSQYTEHSHKVVDLSLLLFQQDPNGSIQSDHHFGPAVSWNSPGSDLFGALYIKGVSYFLKKPYSSNLPLITSLLSRVLGSDPGWNRIQNKSSGFTTQDQIAHLNGVRPGWGGQLDPELVESRDDIAAVLSLLAGHEHQAVLVILHRRILDLQQCSSLNRSQCGSCSTKYEKKSSKNDFRSEMEVTEIILAKVSRLCQLSSHSRGFLSRL